MEAGNETNMEVIYPHCRSCLKAGDWDQMIEATPGEEEPDVLADVLSSRLAEDAFPPFLPDLSRLEWSIHRAKNSDCSFAPQDHLVVNPSLELVRLSWKKLLAFMSSREEPQKGLEFVVTFKDPKSGELIARVASDAHLLALKLVVEGISSKEAAGQGKVSVTTVDAAVDRAIQDGLLLAPLSRIRRNPQDLPRRESTDQTS